MILKNHQPLRSSYTAARKPVLKEEIRTALVMPLVGRKPDYWLVAAKSCYAEFRAALISSASFDDFSELTFGSPQGSVCNSFFLFCSATATLTVVVFSVCLISVTYTRVPV